MKVVSALFYEYPMGFSEILEDLMACIDSKLLDEDPDIDFEDGDVRIYVGKKINAEELASRAKFDPHLTYDLSEATICIDFSIDPSEIRMEWNDSCEDEYIDMFKIEKVVFNKPHTVVLWNDGTKTVVTKQDGDKWDPEKGLAMAILKKLYAGSHYIKEINYWMEHAIDTSKKKKKKKVKKDK